jgi:hypothetical protein
VSDALISSAKRLTCIAVARLLEGEKMAPVPTKMYGPPPIRKLPSPVRKPSALMYPASE